MKLFAALVLSFVSSFAAAASYEAGTYQIDAAHSKVGFEIPHLVISTVDGQFTTFEGSVDLNEKFEKSKVKMSVDTASINTGNAKRDDHLRSPDFFDATKFPKMTFDSSEVKGTPEAFKLVGELAIHGKKKKVAFDAKYLGAVSDGMGNKKAAFSATTKINRKDFGLTWAKAVEAGPVVGDEVTINLKLEAGKPEKKADAAAPAAEAKKK